MNKKALKNWTIGIKKEAIWRSGCNFIAVSNGIDDYIP